MSNKILTIGIPTFNRDTYLDKCLHEIVTQLNGFSDLIEIQVSDNASTDDTKLIIDKYYSQEYDIKYFRHNENIGMDGNFYSLYQSCATKYLWMLSDDDFLLPGALKKIMHIVRNKEFGVLYLNNLWFEDESDIPLNFFDIELLFTEYKKPLDFVNRVNYWFTFMSGNIVNKELVVNIANPEKFNGTLLTQLGWIIPAVFQGLPNYVIDNIILACKANNTGGYKLFRVFGKNFNFVMDSLIKQGCDPRIKRIINNNLLKNFFPIFLNKRNENFDKERYMFSMISIFWKYKLFWTNIFPSLLKKRLNTK